MQTKHANEHFDLLIHVDIKTRNYLLDQEYMFVSRLVTSSFCRGDNSMVAA